MFKNKKIVLLIFSLINIFLINPVSAAWDASALAVFGLPGGSIIGILANTFSWLLGIFFLIGLIGFAISGIMYLTAGGEEGQATKAKNAMTYSVIGVIVGLSGFVVTQAISRMLGEASIF